jgi:3-oxoacyl-[acyl-carrier protein] reductase
VITTNLKSAYNCSKAALRPMMRQTYGRIVNIASVAGLVGNPGQTNYSASKAGLIGFTKSLAKEVGRRNITVNAVAPGFIPTDLTNELLSKRQDDVINATPLGRLGTVEDVARAVAFFVSEDASFVTGQVLSVDGGMAM